MAISSPKTDYDVVAVDVRISPDKQLIVLTFADGVGPTYSVGLTFLAAESLQAQLARGLLPSSTRGLHP